MIKRKVKRFVLHMAAILLVGLAIGGVIFPVGICEAQPAGPGSAIKFDGINDYVSINNNTGTDFTLEAWIFSISTSLTGSSAWEGNGIIWSDVWGNANDFVLSILNNKLAFWDGSSGGGETNGSKILLNAWHHIAVVRDGGAGTRLYVDGNLDGPNPGPAGNVALNANSAIHIGGNTLDGRYFNGIIDEVRIWNRALSQTEIQSNMNRTLTGSESGLLNYYRFDEGSGTVAQDDAGNNDGTLHNGPKWWVSRAHVGDWQQPAQHVVNIYFGGTGEDEGWWQHGWPPLSPATSREIMALLHHYQIEAPTYHKFFVHGVEAVWNLGDPCVCWIPWEVWCWYNTLNQAEAYLDDLLDYSDQNDHVVKLNLVGYSRGAVTNMRFYNQRLPDIISDHPDMIHNPNILSIDPVPGDDSHLGSWEWELEIAPAQYVGIYCRDERSYDFNPVIPYLWTPADRTLMLTLPGTHETIVGNLSADGHSVSLCPNWAWDTTELAVLRNVYKTTGRIAIELLNSPNWGKVPFDDAVWKELYGVTGKSTLESVKKNQFFTDIQKPMNDTEFPQGYDTQYVYSLMRNHSFIHCYKDCPHYEGASLSESSRKVFRYSMVSSGIVRQEVCLDDQTDVPLLGTTILDKLSDYNTLMDPYVAWKKIRMLGWDDENIDDDDDGVLDRDDNCPNVSNPGQEDVNGNGKGDACELPPVANAGPDQTVYVDSACLASVTLDGSGSSDQEGDTLSYTWTWPSGAASGVKPTISLGLGIYTITLTVSDGQKTGSDTVIVTVTDNIPPIPDTAVLPTITGECSAAITTTPTATDNCSGKITGTTSDPLSYSTQGTFTVTWTYDDGRGNTTTQTQTVIVKDTIPPVIENISANPNLLWPPNHKMIPVTVNVIASDNCGNPVCRIPSVSSNEPVNGLGDGDTSPDWEITGNLTLNLRAERSGKGSGRIYTIGVMCTDVGANSSSGNVSVNVPLDQGKN